MAEPKLTVLVTAISKKWGLLRSLQELEVTLIGIDFDPEAEARECCDTFITVPRNDDSSYEQIVQQICQQHAVGLVIPTREEELGQWQRFSETWARGLFVTVSSQACLEICEDKIRTFAWLREQGFATPSTCLRKEIEGANMDYPLFAKPRQGSGSKGAMRVDSSEALSAVPADAVLQPFLAGEEYTINCYVDRQGECRCVIPHRREAVSGGEVSRATTVDELVLQDLGMRLMKALPGVCGPLNFQVFWCGGGSEPQITDINPRFGGGYPLAHAAGARFSHWLVSEASGAGLNEKECIWRAGVHFEREGASWSIRDC